MKRDLLVTVTLPAFGMLTVMSGAIVVPALNSLAAHFAGPQTQIANFRASLTLVMPASGIVISAPLTGRAADRHGRRSTLAVSFPTLKASRRASPGARNARQAKSAPACTVRI